MKYLILGILAALVLSGCSALNTYVAAQNAAAVKDTKAANDNLVKGLEEGVCEVPIGAVIRNLEFIPIAQAACLPAGVQSNPAQLFQNMMQSGVVIKPAYDQNTTVPAVPVTAPVPTPAPVTQNTSGLTTYKPPQRSVPKTSAPSAAPNPAPTAPVVAPAPTPAAPVPKTQPFGALPPPSTGFGAVGQ